MKSVKLQVVFLVLLCVVLLGCEGLFGKKKPASLFPMRKGMVWTYKIEIGETEPLHLKEIDWNLGGSQGMRIQTRGRFVPCLLRESGEQTKIFFLKMRVKEVTIIKRNSKQIVKAEIEVLKDSLGIFEDAKQVFWVMTEDEGKPVVLQITTYSPGIPGAPADSWGNNGAIEDGISTKLILFVDEKGIAISLGKGEPIDTLVFAGVGVVPGEKKVGSLCFVRVVKGGEKEKAENDYSKAGKEVDIIRQAFEEYMWFVPGKGLYLLEQKIGDEVSMTWRLIDFYEEEFGG